MANQLMKSQYAKVLLGLMTRPGSTPAELKRTCPWLATMSTIGIERYLVEGIEGGDAIDMRRGKGKKSDLVYYPSEQTAATLAQFVDDAYRIINHINKHKT
jgi:hypothetical protein